MGGNLQLGKVCVLDRKATAKLGAVPLCHIHLRFPVKLPSALRLPDTRSLSFLASPRQTCTVEGKHKFVLGKSALQVTPAFFDFPIFRWQDFSGTKPFFVRCIEYHTYRIGGALLDPEHRDMGSMLTMSCLLSRPSDMEGGVFITWDDGKAVHHDDLQRGHAVVFHSERVHNVGAVMGGTRHSLVIELWLGLDNKHDRHS